MAPPAHSSPGQLILAQRTAPVLAGWLGRLVVVLLQWKKKISLANFVLFADDYSKDSGHTIIWYRARVRTELKMLGKDAGDG